MQTFRISEFRSSVGSLADDGAALLAADGDNAARPAWLKQRRRCGVCRNHRECYSILRHTGEHGSVVDRDDCACDKLAAVVEAMAHGRLRPLGLLSRDSALVRLAATNGNPPNGNLLNNAAVARALAKAQELKPNALQRDPLTFVSWIARTLAT